jgi:hypothetical protein
MPATWLNFDFRARLIDDLLGPMKAFKEVQPEKMPSPKLKTQVKRFEGVARSLADAADAATTALRFLKRENLDLLAQWIPAHLKGSAAALRSWVDSSDFRSLLLGAPK